MFTSLEQAQTYIRENQLAMIDLKFSDLIGRWHHVTMPAGQLDEHLMRDGVGFDGSSVGLRSVKAGDMVLRPDLATGFQDPFWEVPTLSFICSAFEADTRQLFRNDPRNIAIRAEDYLRESGVADESRWGPEYEFYVFDEVVFENEVNAAAYHIDSIEADWRSGHGGHGHLNPCQGGYHAIPPRDQLYDLRSEAVVILESMGIQVKYHHHEVGGPGQCEIETPMMGLLRAGDVTQVIKYVVKMVAHRRGQTATFMPKPLYGEAGNGMHFHQHLFKGFRRDDQPQNVFYDVDGYGKLSQAALWYIGGLLQHGAAVLAFTNPSTNSYRRLVPGFEAPVNAFFSLGNRSAAIRVPKYADQPATARFEFRPPDATCNIYLALAVQLMAGLDGICKQLDPGELGLGPVDHDVFSWNDEQRNKIKSLPTSLSEALDALHDDHDFLLQGQVFDEEQILEWIRIKRAEESNVRRRPHPYEVALYLDA